MDIRPNYEAGMFSGKKDVQQGLRITLRKTRASTHWLSQSSSTMDRTANQPCVDDGEVSLSLSMQPWVSLKLIMSDALGVAEEVLFQRRPCSLGGGLLNGDEKEHALSVLVTTYVPGHAVFARSSFSLVLRNSGSLYLRSGFQMCC